MAPRSTQPGATANKLMLTPVMTLEGHEPWAKSGHHEYKYKSVSSISYFPNSKEMISGSRDRTIRRWDLREGKEIKEAPGLCGKHIDAVRVSRDGRWVATAGGGELNVCEVETGVVRTFHHEDHFPPWIKNCIDISSDSTLLAACVSEHSIAWIWSLDTGKPVAGPFKFSDDYTDASILRFSGNSRKLAVMSDWPGSLQVWDIQTQKLDVTLQKSTPNIFGPSLPLPVFWTVKDKSIVAPFSFTGDHPTTIYEFDASTLETVGAPFKGNAGAINLALSSDCVLLASTFSDSTIKLWAFESRQLLASFDVQAPFVLILSPDSSQLAYTTFLEPKIYICNIPAIILAGVGLAKKTITCPTDLLNSNATRRTVRCKPVISPVISPVPHPPRPLSIRDPHAFLHFVRKLLPSSRTDAVRHTRTNEPRDPLDFPATSPLPRPHIKPHEDCRPTPAPLTIQSSTTASSTFKSRVHRLSTWWPVQTEHTSPATVDVPLAQGKQRNAAAGAPGEDDDVIRDEEYVPPPSPNPDSRQPPMIGQVKINTGEHGSDRFCFCL